MAEPRPSSPEGPELSRREFLAKRLVGRLAGLLGAGALANPAAATVETGRSDAADSFSPRDLRRMSRGEVKAALARIRAQRRER